MNGNITDKLAIEEFKQIHATIRQRETAMNQMLIVTTTGSITLLAATSAFVFQASEMKSGIYCYLILLPIPLINFMTSMITLHRSDIYRMRYYLTVFFEEKYGGAQLGIHLFRFRKMKKGESHDAVTLVFWALFIICSLFFLTALRHSGARVFVDALILVPLGFWMAYQNSKFHNDRSSMKAVWLAIMNEQEQAGSGHSCKHVPSA